MGRDWDRKNRFLWDGTGTQIPKKNWDETRPIPKMGNYFLT